ncbi:hypothetical protein [Paraburkholderia sp. DGU8]|uniref:hypothetical protein n=1 Tax=Paraburkholderia sp. DGU8 TaxID=3161997 RepID=UPI0034665E1A
MKWCDADLLALDRIYAESGVAFHARPLRAAADLLGSEFVLGVVGNSEAEEIMDAYQRLIPEVSTSWPGMGIGLAASVDRVRKVVVAVALGQPAISLEQGLGFASRSEWQQWCRDDPVIAAGNAFAFADIYDFTYGLNELEGGNAVAIQYWRLALSNLEDVANSLFNGYSVASISQPICMTAELAMKGALIHLGDDPAELAKGRIGHRHSVLAERLAKACAPVTTRY